MKAKFLVAALVTSCALNIVGLVYLILFQNLSHHYKMMHRERNQMAQNLTSIRASHVVAEAIESGTIVQRSFNSLADGTEDSYAYMPPATSGRLDNILLVYLHGMGSNYLEPFSCPPQNTIAQALASKYPDACLMAPSYRKSASWASDEAMSDITQNVRAMLQQYPFAHIVLSGTSMGGCTALLYATYCPPDIKAKLAGIISAEGAGDLAKLSDATDNRSVKAAIRAALGGTDQQVPNAYKKRSFLPNIDKLSKDCPVAIISASADAIVPAKLQEDLREALQKHGNPTKFISVDGGHGVAPADLYMNALDFIMQSQKPGSNN